MSKVPVKSVATSLRLLEELRDRGPCSITALADRIDRPKATVYYHVKTLEEHGYADETDDGYDLGLRLLEMGGQTRYRHGFPEVVGPNLTRLSRETNEIAVYGVRDGDESVVLNLARPPGLAETLDVSVGARAPLHSTALGKALLSGLSEDRLAEALDGYEFERFTSETVADEAAFHEELESVRSEGHAFDHGEYDADVHGVATAVGGEDGRLRGAIGIVGPASRLYSDRFAHELPHLVERFGERIEYELASE